MNAESRVAGRDMRSGRVLATDEALAALVSAGIASQAEALMKGGGTGFVGGGAAAAWCNAFPPSVFVMLFADTGGAMNALLPGSGPPGTH